MVLLEIIEMFPKPPDSLFNTIICQWKLEPIKGVQATETYKYTHRHIPQEDDTHSFLFNAKRSINNTHGFLHQDF